MIVQSIRRHFEHILHGDKCGVLDNPLALINCDHLLEPLSVDEPEGIVELPFEVADHIHRVKLGIILIKEALQKNLC